MVKDEDDWWSPVGEVPDPEGEEVDYGYLIDDDETPRPDPLSRRQPDGVHGLSRTHDATRPPVAGRRLDRTPARRAPSSTSCTSGPSPPRAPSTPRSRSSTTCASIGVDFVEVMPVNAFNGTHNWGYDGVLWHAVHEGYGGPAGYQRFVDGCHAAGLGVIQDVVYNHLGPSGNYLPLFGPYLKSRHQHLGRPGQPRRRRLRRRTPLHPRQRGDVAVGLPRRRAAARRRARARGLLRRAPPRGDGGRGRRAVRPPRPPAHADRRVGPQRRQRW